MATNAGVDLSDDERQTFFNLVYMYADIFAGTTADLGRTSKLKHCIDTGTAPPIRQWFIASPYNAEVKFAS